MAPLEFIECPKCGLSSSWTDFSPDHPQGKKITTKCFNCGHVFAPSASRSKGRIQDKEQNGVRIRFCRTSNAFFAQVGGDEEQCMTPTGMIKTGLAENEKEVWQRAANNPESDEPPGGWGQVGAGPAFSAQHSWPFTLISAGSVVAVMAIFIFLTEEKSHNDLTPKTDMEAAVEGGLLFWREIELDIELLERNEVANEADLDELRRKLDDLWIQPRKDWSSQSSLEATDNLRREYQGELKRVVSGLIQIERALGTLQDNQSTLANEDLERCLEKFDRALQKLCEGALKPNPALLEKLMHLDPGFLKSMDPEQVQELREEIRLSAQRFGKCKGYESGEDDWLEEPGGGDQLNQSD